MIRLWFVPFILAVGWLSYVPLSLADYIIYLKSGRHFVTDRYWEEGGEIKFHFKGGVLGVPKATVVSVEEVRGEPAATEVPRPETASPEKKEGDKTVEKAERKGEEKRLQELTEKKRVLKKKLDDALKRLRETSRNKDKAAKKAVREEMRAISRELYALTEEVKKINNGELPEGWWQD
ncbi:MAG: hypothetical protein JRL30_14320 [Deltaproteobacteria bacterium]|nr:hypothetical protein [Deltaproteobacteria bacterium]